MKNEKGIEIIEHAFPANWDGKVNEELQNLLDEYLWKFDEFADGCEGIPYNMMHRDEFCAMLRICLSENIRFHELWEKEIGKIYE